MKKNSIDSKTKNIESKSSTVSITLTVLSVCAYYVPGFIDRQLGLSSEAYRITMLIVAVIAMISAIAAIVAILKASSWWKKLLFTLFLLVSSGICGIAFLVAGLAGA